MKKLYSWLAVLCACHSLMAQNNITGHFIDQETNLDISEASVLLLELKTQTTTNKEGLFEFKNLKPGSYLLEISASNYTKQVRSISVPQKGMIHFALAPDIAEMNEVIVTAVSKITQLKLSPLIITAIDANELNTSSSTNLIDGLKNIPGINQITTGAAISKPIIRGLGYNRIITLYNGIRQEGGQWGDEHGIEIDAYSIGRIEIVKGPGSLMYGSDGIAGVLNFLPPSAPALGKMETRILSEYQSNNGLFGSSFSMAGHKKSIQWAGQFSHKQASNYKNKYDGKVLNSGFNELNGNVFFGLSKNWGYSHLRLSTFNTQISMPEGERDSLGQFIFTQQNGQETVANSNDLNSYKIGFPYQAINHNRIQSNSFIILKKGSINADIGYQNSHRKEYGDIQNPNDIELYFLLNTLNYNTRYNLPIYKGWESSIGISGMYQTNKNLGEEFLIPEHTISDFGTFLFAQKTLKQLTFASGFRIDRRQINSQNLELDSNESPISQPQMGSETKFEAFTKNYQNMSASLGVSYQLSRKNTLKFNLSQGFRAPNLAELASNGRHEGSFRFEYGNTQLKPEVSRQIDLAFMRRSKHISLDISPFANFVSQYIYSQKLLNASGLDSFPDPNENAPAFQFTQANATLLGGEIYLDIHPHPYDWLHIAQSFSMVNASLPLKADSVKFLPFIPPPRYRLEIKAEIKKLSPYLSHTYIQLAADYFFKQNRILSAYNTETETPAYFLTSASIGTSVQQKGQKSFMDIFINIQNMGDVAFQSHLNRLKYAPQNTLTGRNGLFNMGRNVSVKIVIKL
jgi:iron complex outermembrane recepter protein